MLHFQPKNSLITIVGLSLVLLVSNLPASANDAFAGVKLNELQMIGSHNSYKQAIDRSFIDLAKKFDENIERLDYAHLPLADQLTLGLRGLELDVVHDPTGGRFSKPLGLKLMQATQLEPRPFDPEDELEQPGFKILHVQDIDFRSHNLTLKGALEELRTWSNENTRHLPVIVTMNLKQGRSPLPGGTTAPEFDTDALDLLDEALRDGLGSEKILTPDMVRGTSETLESAILSRGWPALEEIRGRFLFVMDEGATMQKKYTMDHPSLSGRVMFTTTSPGKPEAAFLIINDPIRSEAEIKKLVGKGYFVRTRADAETLEMRRGDYRRFEAAQRSGAHLISTDYYLPDWRIRPEFCIRFADQNFVRDNPVKRSDSE